MSGCISNFSNLFQSVSDVPDPWVNPSTLGDQAIIPLAATELQPRIDISFQIDLVWRSSFRTCLVSRCRTLLVKHQVDCMALLSETLIWRERGLFPIPGKKFSFDAEKVTFRPRLGVKIQAVLL